MPVTSRCDAISLPRVPCEGPVITFVGPSCATMPANIRLSACPNGRHRQRLLVIRLRGLLRGFSSGPRPSTGAVVRAVPGNSRRAALSPPIPLFLLHVHALLACPHVPSRHRVGCSSTRMVGVVHVVPFHGPFHTFRGPVGSPVFR